MKRVLLFIVFIANSFASYAQNNSSDDKQAMAMLKSFYTAYMTELAGSDPAFEKKCNLLLHQYCTQAFLTNLSTISKKYEIDWDPIIKGQDSRMDCVKNLSFKKNPKGLNRYTVSYFYIDDFSKKKQVSTINLIVTKQKDGFKIASVFLDTPKLPTRI